jgi:hypothetical protein
MAGGPLGFLTQPQSAPAGGSPSGWEPTVVYLLILILAEMIVFGFISRMLR